MDTRFWTTRQLRSQGWTRDDLTDAVRGGRLLRPRRGHYCDPDAPPELVRAVRVGGLATATTASAALGLWTPPDDRTHVYLPGNAARLRSPDDRSKPFTQRDDVCLHWGSRLTGVASVEPLSAPLIAIEHAFGCMRREYALAILESALHKRYLRQSDVALLAAALPEYFAAILQFTDGRAESGVETIARYFLQVAGLRVEVQVHIDGVGRVDLLVEGRLIIELDGRAWHDDESTFRSDRRRDAASSAQRYRTLRFTYAQVLFDWPLVEAAIRAALTA